MSLSPGEAADSLKEIEQTGRRSASAFGYAQSSPYYVIWGVAWIIGYAGTDLLLRLGHPAFISPLWIVLLIAGVSGCALVTRRQYYQNRTGTDLAKARAIGRRIGASTVIVYLFIFATFGVLKPRTPEASGAFVPLVVAAYYALLGVWKGARFLVAGAVVAILTLGGYFLLRDYFLPWMAVVGGGSLMLVGIWMRTI